ncbi:uncharacterized protein K460DRAFT_419823 [Cucurbitaria berberidis CBS 394.84]|uniref:Uncharacterized protein n=1 Tax=Cucurbitaria berberidis CBS 394.84 TaxID=1168544 RepID=A0A9P4G9U9_9PLEO|nr:uncharacterized protein K460DRAFT_419823 [Cucurbitaria berberidis CBS 394.84]KAF1841828.1 hypothetical protein K460DRAFT_419823 [Cucurbitaria berberidis CBS 394.84]
MARRKGNKRKKQADSAVAQSSTDVQPTHPTRPQPPRSTDRQPSTSPEPSSSQLAEERKKVDSVVAPKLLDAEHAQPTGLPTQSFTNPQPATKTGPSSSRPTKGKGRAETPSEPSVDWELPPWPSEEFGAPLTTKVFLEGLRELCACSQNHIRASAWMQPGASYWFGIIKILYQQMETVASRELAAMNAEELELEKGEMRGSKAKNNPAWDFLEILRSQTGPDRTNQWVRIGDMWERVNNKLNKVNNTY